VSRDLREAVHAARSTVVVDVLVSTYEEWRSDRTIRLGAGLAYYGLFSLSSVLAVALGAFRIIGRQASVEEAFTERFVELFGVSSEPSVGELFERLDGSTGTQLGLIGLGSLLVTGSLFFLALEDALHQIWGVPVRSGIRSSLQRRLVSLIVLLGAATTLVLSFTIQAATSLLERILPSLTGGTNALAALLTSVLSWSLLAAAITLLFHFLPSTDVPWRPAAIAAVITCGFLVVGTAVIGWYLRTIGASSLGGVASTPIAVLLWIYYEAQILLAGAQLNKVLVRRVAGRNLA
jgi:membrane protein